MAMTYWGSKTVAEERVDSIGAATPPQPRACCLPISGFYRSKRHRVLLRISPAPMAWQDGGCSD